MPTGNRQRAFMFPEARFVQVANVFSRLAVRRHCSTFLWTCAAVVATIVRQLDNNKIFAAIYVQIGSIARGHECSCKFQMFQRERLQQRSRHFSLCTWHEHQIRIPCLPLTSNKHPANKDARSETTTAFGFITFNSRQSALMQLSLDNPQLYNAALYVRGCSYMYSLIRM